MIVVLNNKCNLNKEEFKYYINNINKIDTNHTLILCPSFPNISLFSSNFIKLGSQNVSSENNGAYTGEVSAEQLKSFDVNYCIVGHSERRINQKEKNEEIHKKINKLLEQDICPILCIGETEEERMDGLEEKIVLEELDFALQGLKTEEIEKIIVAYEPIWSIGTGLTPTNYQIDTIINFIKDKYPQNKVLYGGSVNEVNLDELKKCTTIDGYLIGSLSLNPSQLNTFVKKL